MENLLVVPMVWNSNYLIPHWSNQLIFYPSTLQGGTALWLWTNTFWSESLLSRMLTGLITSLVSDFLKTTNRKGRATRRPPNVLLFFLIKKASTTEIFLQWAKSFYAAHHPNKIYVAVLKRIKMKQIKWVLKMNQIFKSLNQNTG